MIVKCESDAKEWQWVPRAHKEKKIKAVWFDWECHLSVGRIFSSSQKNGCVKTLMFSINARSKCNFRFFSFSWRSFTILRESSRKLVSVNQSTPPLEPELSTLCSPSSLWATCQCGKIFTAFFVFFTMNSYKWGSPSLFFFLLAILGWTGGSTDAAPHWTRWNGSVRSHHDHLLGSGGERPPLWFWRGNINVKLLQLLLLSNHPHWVCPWDTCPVHPNMDTSPTFFEMEALT